MLILHMERGVLVAGLIFAINAALDDCRCLMSSSCGNSTTYIADAGQERHKTKIYDGLEAIEEARWSDEWLRNE